MSLAFPCQAPAGYFHYLALALLVHCVWSVSVHVPQHSYLSETDQGLASLPANLSIDKDTKCHLHFLARRLRAIFITSR